MKTKLFILLMLFSLKSCLFLVGKKLKILTNMDQKNKIYQKKQINRNNKKD